MIDTHCHLDKEDYENVIEVIKKMGNNIIIVSGVDNKTNQNVIDLCNKYDNVYGTLGYHPEYVTEFKEENLVFIEKNISNPKIVGIGEIGLDYYWDKENHDKQKEIFIKFIKLAQKYKKTIVIHSREAINDTYNILKDHISKNDKVVIHCFGSSLEMAKKFVDIGCMLGIGGVVTFKNAKSLVEVVKEIDINYLVLETDSPYLTPEPFRGKKNEPYNIIYVARKIAEIRNVDEQIVLSSTTQNAIRQFDLKVKM